MAVISRRCSGTPPASARILTASLTYLYLPMIPDIAILRDRLGKRKLLYSVLALGWTGTEYQQRVLNRAIAIMAVLVIPIAISVHSVVSFVFSMTLQPAWHSTIFGPYFVVGAIFSGIAGLIVTMIIFRKAYGLQYYLKPIHFRYLGQLLLIMALLWFYFTFAEYLDWLLRRGTGGAESFLVQVHGTFLAILLVDGSVQLRGSARLPGKFEAAHRGQSSDRLAVHHCRHVA